MSNTPAQIIVVATESNSEAALVRSRLDPSLEGLLIGRARQTIENLEQNMARRYAETDADQYAAFLAGIAVGVTAASVKDQIINATLYPENPHDS